MNIKSNIVESPKASLGKLDLLIESSNICLGQWLVINGSTEQAIAASVGGRKNTRSNAINGEVFIILGLIFDLYLLCGWLFDVFSNSNRIGNTKVILYHSGAVGGISRERFRGIATD